MHVGVALLVGRKECHQPPVPGSPQLPESFLTDGGVVGGETDKLIGSLVVGRRDRTRRRQQDEKQAKPQTRSTAGGERLGEHHATIR